MSTGSPAIEKQRARLARLSRALAVLAAYSALAVLSTWPLARRLPAAVALGPYESNTVSLTTEWTLWWNADRLAHLYAGYWNAPIFAPAHRTFALSEPQPLSGLFFAPIYRLTGSLETAYGLVVLGMLVANGAFTRHLARALGLRSEAAFLAGAMAVLLPFAHTELSVLPFFAAPGALAAVSTWLGFVRTPSVRGAVLLGASVAASYALSCQLTVLFVPVLALAGLGVAPRAFFERRSLALLGLAALVCLVLVSPIAVPQYLASRQFRMTRDLDVVRDFSAGVNRYARAPWPELFGIPAHLGKQARRSLFPGTVKVALAAAAIVIAWRRRRWETSLQLPLLVILGGMLVGVGPLADVGPVSLYRVLTVIVPGLGRIRGLFHVAIFVQLGVVLIAAAAIHEALERPPARFAAPGQARIWRAACVGVGMLAAVELWPRGQRFAEPRSFAAEAGWTVYLRERTSEDAILAFVPFPATGKVGDFAPTAEWMRLGAAYRRRMVNGYSSYFPHTYDRVAARARKFPARSAIEALEKAGVSYVVVDRRLFPGSVASERLERAFTDDAARVDVYRVTDGR